MLEPSRDRLDYGAMLRPPEPGFSLVHAVASTYSLELSALLAALLPLGVDGDAKSHCRENPLFMLYVFKKLFRKISVFCDAAAVSAQDVQRNKLLAFLDRIVFPVRHRTAFHPKFWLLKFEREGEIRYRLAVLSKNITFDRSWDVVMFFDGVVKDSRSNGAPLADMLDFLKQSQWGKGKRLQELSSMAAEVRNVEFFNDEIQPGEFLLLPFGVKSEALAEDAVLLNPAAKFSRLMVMSPFLARTAVSELFARGRDGAEKLLFSRKQAFADCFQGEEPGIQSYCVKDEVVFGEESAALESQPEKTQEEDIHAKIYLFQQYQSSTPYLYLGSANLTRNGMNEANVELLVRVKLRGHNIYETMRKDLLPEGENGVFELCGTVPEEKNTEEEEAMEDLKKVFRKFVLEGKRITASVEETSAGYVVSLHCPETLCCEYKIEIAPLNGNWQNFSSTVEFAAQPAETLSDFYLIRFSNDLAKLERILVIDTVSSAGLEEVRQSALESVFLKRSADFLEYFSYILAEDAYAQALQMNGSVEKKTDKKNTGFGENYQSALYEKLLYWSSADPGRLQEIESVVRYSPELPKETRALLKLCETFYHAAGELK